MKKLEVGLIKGRHELPVDKYIFENEELNPLDVRGLKTKAELKIINLLKEANIDKVYTTVCLSNEIEYVDIPVWQYDCQLVIYVTGLTVALTAVLSAFVNKFLYGIVLKHYDKDSGSYYEQVFQTCGEL